MKQLIFAIIALLTITLQAQSNFGVIKSEGEIVVKTNDSRLSDSRTPNAHASTHATGQADAIAPADIGAEPAITTLPLTKGGLGANVSAYTGVPYISGGSTTQKTIGTASGNLVERSAANAIAADNINEVTAGNGVDIDGVKCKDGQIGAGTDPTEKLHVNGTVRIDQSTSNSILKLNHSGVITYDFNLPDTNTLECAINSASTKTLKLVNDGTGDFSAEIYGSVGVGRAPTTKMDVYASSGSVLSLVESGSLASTNEARMLVAGKKSGGGNRYATLGVTYIDQSGSGGSNEACGYMSVSSGNSNSNYFWADDVGVFRVSTSFLHIGSNSGTVVGTQTSDERLKNINPAFTHGLSQVLALQPIQFTFKNDQQNVQHTGFSAQQVRLIIPESVYDTKEDVDGTENTKLAMDYTAIIPVLVKAIQEQQAEINALRSRIEALEAK